MPIRMLLCCEAWGAREALFEHALVGYSGFELSLMLSEIGLAPRVSAHRPSEYEMIAYWKSLRDNHGIEIANVFNAKPEGNDIKTFFTNRKEGDLTLPPLVTGKFLRPELRFHVETLWERVTALEPNLCVAFGNTACWALLGQTKISALRGTVLRSTRLGVKVLPTYHPAAVLRQWNLRPIVLTDLEKASREAASPEIKRVPRWLTVNPTLAEIRQWLNRPADFYAVDIENHTKMIDMVGFARSHDDAIVIPFFDENKPGGSYWPTVIEEMDAWKLLDRALRKPVPKIFQNGIYDLTHLLRAGLRPTMCEHDTMLLHHALYPEMLKGLGFLGSIYSDERPWKLMRGKGDTLKRDE
jgi:hypothetical protein